MKDASTISRLRQRLRRAVERYASLAKKLLAERGPVTRGTFHSHGTRCGKANCKCARGELHHTVVLAVSEEGRQRNIYIRPKDRPVLQRRTEAYRRFRRTRAEMDKVAAEVRQLTQELLEAIIEPYDPPRGEGKRKKATRK